MNLTLKLKNMEEFSSEIEKRVTNKELLYIEAVVEYAEELGMDVDNPKLKSLLTPKLQQTILKEAYKYNKIPKSRQKKPIPIDKLRVD